MKIPIQFKIQDPKISSTLSKKKISLIVSEWNSTITEKLFIGAKNCLLEKGVQEKNIFRINSPGCFELPLMAQRAALQKKFDAIICLGCVIKGETPHDIYISFATSIGIMEVSLKFNIPVTFGVITSNNLKQAKDRAGGKHGNKGVEAAIAVIKILKFF